MDIDYKILYKIQDKVLKIAFDTEREFYLTGGTCLSRFYFEKRYSDDLDFFTFNSQRFNFAVKNIIIALNKNCDAVLEVDAKDFKRVLVDDILQIDFVNDTVPRFKDLIVTKDNFILDNLDNILSNKLNAIIGRDEAKDIFDLFLIDKLHTFSWDEILHQAHEKTHFSDEDLIVRLKTFPKSWLKRIKLIDENFLNDFDERFDKIIENIIKVAQK